MLSSMASYLAAPMLFFVNNSVLDLSSTTSPTASPPPADVTKPHAAPSRLSKKLPGP